MPLTTRTERYEAHGALCDDDRPDQAAGFLRLVLGTRPQDRYTLSWLEYADPTEEDRAILLNLKNRWWGNSRWANTLNV